MAEVGHLGRRSSATSTPSTTGIDPAAAAVPPHGKSLPIDCLHRPGRKPGLRATSRVAAVQREGPAMMATTVRRPPRTSSLGCASCSPMAGCAARSRAKTATSSSSAPSRLRACTAAQQADDVGSAPTELAQRPPCSARFHICRHRPLGYRCLLTAAACSAAAAAPHRCLLHYCRRPLLLLLLRRRAAVHPLLPSASPRAGARSCNRAGFSRQPPLPRDCACGQNRVPGATGSRCVRGRREREIRAF